MDENLQVYLTNARTMLTKFEEAVGWKSVENDDSGRLLVCPYDNGHKMTQKSLESHTKRCKWKKLGYSNDEIKEIFEQEERTKAMRNISVLNSDTIISQIAPLAPPIRSETNFKCLLTPEQRLAIYEAEVAKCFSNNNKTQPDKALYADLESKAFEKLYQKENPDNLTELEMLQKMRDMKRRRQSYRAKNVHITKRSQTEIIRGVLSVHMEELTKLWNPGSNYGKVAENYGYKDDRELQDRQRSTDKRRSRERKPSHGTSRNSRKRSYNDKDERDSHRSSEHKSRKQGRYSRGRSPDYNDERSKSSSRTRNKEKDISPKNPRSKQRTPSPTTSREFSSSSKVYETNISEMMTKIRSNYDKNSQLECSVVAVSKQSMCEPHSPDKKDENTPQGCAVDLISNLNTSEASSRLVTHQNTSNSHSTCPNYSEKTKIDNSKQDCLLDSFSQGNKDNPESECPHRLDDKNISSYHLTHSKDNMAQEKGIIEYSDEGRRRMHKHRKKKKEKNKTKKHKSKHRSRSKS